MNTNEIARERADQIDLGIEQYARPCETREQGRQMMRREILSAITRATEADRHNYNRELHELLDRLKAPVGSSENGHPMGASVRERIVMLFTQSRAAPASAEQQNKQGIKLLLLLQA